MEWQNVNAFVKPHGIQKLVTLISLYYIPLFATIITAILFQKPVSPY